MIPPQFEVDQADCGGERDEHRLIRQAVSDGQAGRPARSEHPGYGVAYAVAQRTRMVLSRERVLCVSQGVHCTACGHKVAAAFMLACACVSPDPLCRELGMFAMFGADADGSDAEFLPGRYLAALVRDGARVIDLACNDVTHLATPLQ